MYYRYSMGFLMASLIQAGIVFITESAGISSLNAPFTFTQLIAHIIVGQLAGFLLLFLTNNMEVIARINAPWNQDMATVLSSLLAFVVYGVIATLVIKRYERKYAHT